MTNIIKLASNENPFGPSPLALAAMQRALADSWLYPDGSGHVLKQKLAPGSASGINQITLGNGSNDVLVLLAEAFLKPGLEAVYSQYAFAVYPIAIQSTGATGIAVPASVRTPNMPLGHDLAAMARAIRPRTRVLFIANPNNPTGTWMPANELEAFIAAVPAHVVVALDEAYFEYTEGMGLQNGIEWLGRYPNLVVFRTFSKAYGLAGVRVGFAVSHPTIADMLNRVRQPFNVSVVGLAGAAAALDDPAHVGAAVKVAVAERMRVAARLAVAALAWCLRRAISCCCTRVQMPGSASMRCCARASSCDRWATTNFRNTCASRWARSSRMIGSSAHGKLASLQRMSDDRSSHSHHRRTLRLGQGHHQPTRCRRVLAGICSTAARCTGWWHWPASTGNSIPTMFPST